MKKILSILGTITLIGTSATSLVACNTKQYSEDDLKKEKEKNNININGNILEWIAPQERPFSQVDNKLYVVIWRGDKSDDWRIIKFQNNELKIGKTFDKYSKSTLELKQEMAWSDFDICIVYSGAWSPKYWGSDNGTSFKAVYRWRGGGEPDIFEIDNNGNIKN